MADRSDSLFLNFPGEWFVDSSCINCDACRQLAPSVFAEAEDYAYVKAQPETDDQERRALRALLACPTGSIGNDHPARAREVIEDFPLTLNREVYYLGFNSVKSAGGNSYLITNPGGNWMIDAPRFTGHLKEAIDQAGGIEFLLYTHAGSIADGPSYASLFGAQQIIHRDALEAVHQAEVVIDGVQEIELISDYQILPTPGIRKGHLSLLYNRRYLFSGELLWWNRYRDRLTTSRERSRYSREEQLESLQRLTNYPFDMILPAHGNREKRSAEEMRDQLDALVMRFSKDDNTDSESG